MEPDPTFLPNLAPVALPAEEISACQVWMNLTQDQQAQLMQAIVLICREVIWPAPQLQESEVTDD